MVSEEILVSTTPMETRVALVESGVVQEIHIERIGHRGIVGNIYSGKVVRILPGMEAAFVEIGSERTGFLHMSDIAALDGGGRENHSGEADTIRKYLHDGKKILVQVTKDPLGDKGARLTTRLSLSSRYLVLAPHSTRVGVSRQIEDASERDRLHQLVALARREEDMLTAGGLVIRTAASGVGLNEIQADLRYLKRLWATVLSRGKATDRPTLLYEDLPLDFRAIRDLARPSLERVRIDSLDCFSRLRDFCTDYIPEVSPLLDHYQDDRPLFDVHAVEAEIQRALQRRVELNSGGYLIFDQREAMTTIDVNTGSFVGGKNLEETVFKTNLEAASVLARQVRLRNLAGIIIIDFIDMLKSDHRRQVLRALEKAMSGDQVKHHITGISQLGLVEMTRKRTRESLVHMLCEECASCGGRGVLKSAETVCYEIFREIMRSARGCESDTLMVLAGQAVVDRLLGEESANFADLEKLVNKSISFRVEPGYNQEHFDLVLL